MRFVRFIILFSALVYSSTIKVAILDDAFFMADPVLEPYFKESRSIDFKWDQADLDRDPRIPMGRENIFYHGTFLSGIMVHQWELVWGSEASEKVQIFPVKIVSDHAKEMNMQAGYMALERLLALPVDAILIAWSGGEMPDSAHRVWEAWRAKGVPIFVSAGNHGARHPSTPSGSPGAYTIAALDRSENRLSVSNWGNQVSLSAVAESQIGRSSLRPQWIQMDGNTSGAAAAVLADWVLLKSEFPKVPNHSIMDALINTAKPILSIEPSLLGAGKIQIDKAREYLKSPNNHLASLKNPTGILNLNSKKWKDLDFSLVEPEYQIEIFFTEPISIGNRKDRSCNELDFQYFADGKPVKRNRVKLLSGDTLKISAQNLKVRSKKSCRIQYQIRVQSRENSNCIRPRIFEADSGYFDDGSGDLNYAPNSECSIYLKAAEHQWIEIYFIEFNTQKSVDYLHIFAGESTRQDDAIALFSGEEIPPALRIPLNQLHFWFLSDELIQMKGFKVFWRFIPAGSGEPGIIK
jgi:hypothetical protein